MGLSTSEKAELSTYQLRYVDQVCFVQWRDNRPLRGGPLTWEIFNKAFLDRFFPRKMREVKVLEFINLRQEGMSVHEYSLKFTKFLKYDLSSVSDPRDEMSHFVMGMSDDLEEEYHSAMLHENMNIYRIMMHSNHVEEERARTKSRDAKIFFMEVLQRIDMRYKTCLGLRSGFQVKSLPSSKRLVDVGCLTLSSRREKVLIHQPRSQLMESVARSTMVIKGQIIVLVVERVAQG